MDNSYIIKGAISPIILRIYREDYLFIIKTVFYNLTYDDFRDNLYIYDFAIVSKYELSKFYYFFSLTKNN